MGVTQGAEALVEVSSYRSLHMDVGASQVEVQRLEGVNQWEECFVSQSGSLRYVPELEITGRGNCWEDSVEWEGRSKALQEKGQEQVILKTDPRLMSKEGEHRVVHHNAVVPESRYYRYKTKVQDRPFHQRGDSRYDSANQRFAKGKLEWQGAYWLEVDR